MVSLEFRRKFRYPDRAMGTYSTKLPVIYRFRWYIALKVWERGFGATYIIKNCRCRGPRLFVYLLPVLIIMLFKVVFCLRILPFCFDDNEWKSHVNQSCNQRCLMRRMVWYIGLLSTLSGWFYIYLRLLIILLRSVCLLRFCIDGIIHLKSCV